ncbi:hypothetical protein [Pseudonocardia sp. HH130630-07]|uniref:hypothetical protein n=1 Tax=Pseudonocardia sp. HH130630-07 TaxID=1690815 RepID=UPI00081515AC|nr:hypothetical protein [Pseudonocardia sp. HH130630-07]ANY05290.1 hypothetical protein AFB00_02025 [Pseudonocardia sp. HH130630-07]
MRVLSALLLLLVGLVVCAGPAAAGPDHHPAATGTAAGSVEAGVLGAAHCPYQPPMMLHAGDADQVPRRDEDDPSPPVGPPATPVAVAAAGHPDVGPAPPPDRVLLAPSPVEQLCVDRN